MTCFRTYSTVRTFAAAATVWLAGVCGASSAVEPSSSANATNGEDVMQGWRVFNEKRCIDCHAVWGQGGRLGPDLGRLRADNLTHGQLAGVMWNHIPKMLAWLKQAGQPPETLSAEDMTNAFALIHFLQQLDEPGDPSEGERILLAKGCIQCHSIDTVGGDVGPDLAKWGAYANPVIWAQMMWEHAASMEEAMKRSDMEWPKLEGADLVHIVAYVRSAGISGEKTYLQPGSPARGKQLFTEKKCLSCHPGSGPDLSQIDLPPSIGALASLMWNHSPEMTRVMREEYVERQPVSPQELADMLAYVLLLRYRDQPGDPIRGRQVFTQKGCIQCHEQGEMAQEVKLSLTQLKQHAAPAKMAAAMWNHGDAMLEQMSGAGLDWPVFEDNEMNDLLAYLKSVDEPESTGNDDPP